MSQRRFHVIEGSGIAKNATLPEEQQLISAAQEGNTAAFKELYEFYKDRIYNLIYYSIDDVQQAEDILQIVFVRVFQALPFFRLESCFLTWVYRVALNECKNRKRRRKLIIPLSRISHEPVTDAAPDEVHASKQLARLIRAAVMNLKPKYRRVVILKYLEELSYDEVASILGCSTGTVASRLYRALQILESRLRHLRTKNKEVQT